MKSGTIRVVWHEGEMFFLSPDGILLDLLDAFDFFNGYISVIRNTVPIDQAAIVGNDDQDPCPTFVGLEVILEDLPERSINCHEIFPDHFEEGDEIYFAFDENFDWDVDFKKSFVEDQAAEKFSHLLRGILKIENDRDKERLSEEYSLLFDAEVKNFILPEFPILRRIVDREVRADEIWPN